MAPFFHQNTSASVSESCGRVERSLHGSLANAMKRPSGALGCKIKAPGIKWVSLLTDNWKRFKRVFSDTHHVIGKEGTKGIEGNNCRLRHRIRRSFRRTCCFSKKMENHIKAFELAFYYINYGYIQDLILCEALPNYLAQLIEWNFREQQYLIHYLCLRNLIYFHLRLSLQQ